jgi:hypothetical protein
MKRKLFLAGTVLALLSAFAYGDDILKKLGTSPGAAEYSILANITGEREFSLPYAKLLPSIVQGDKTGAAKELCAYIREYCSSEAFISKYREKREAAKPTDEPPAMTPELKDMYSSSIKEMEKLLKDPNTAKYLDKKVKEATQKQIDEMKAALAMGNDPAPNKTKWEKNYPADVNQLLKRRLQQYIDLAATVDFSATLVPRGSKMIFANPEYEKKSLQWKACYRAGKEVNAVVTAFARDWMKAL